MRWIIAVVVIVLAVGALVYFGTFAPHVEAPVEDTAATEEPPAEDGAGDEAADFAPVEDAAQEGEAAAPEGEAAAPAEDEISAAEGWNFPEADVVLQGEWYHLDKGCKRLVNDPPPTPMLRQVAVSAGFKPCFLCSRDDAERGPDAGAGVPEEFLGPAPDSQPETATGTEDSPD